MIFYSTGKRPLMYFNVRHLCIHKGEMRKLGLHVLSYDDITMG